MTVDIELLLARHPPFFFRREGGVEGFDGGGVLAAVGGGRRDIHPLSAVKSAGNKLADEERRREVAVRDKADVLLFTADEAAADVISGIAEKDVYVIAHFSGNLKGVLDQQLAELLPLILGSHAKRPEGKYLFALTVLILKPRFRVHNVADDSAVLFKHECKLGNEVGMISHRMHEIMLVRARLIDVPERLAGEFFYCSVVFFCF